MKMSVLEQIPNVLNIFKYLLSFYFMREIGLKGFLLRINLSFDEMKIINDIFKYKSSTFYELSDDVYKDKGLIYNPRQPNNKEIIALRALESKGLINFTQNKWTDKFNGSVSKYCEATVSNHFRTIFLFYYLNRL
jgi:hypothetical protein